MLYTNLLRLTLSHNKTTKKLFQFFLLS